LQQLSDCYLASSWVMVSLAIWKRFWEDTMALPDIKNKIKMEMKIGVYTI